ERRRGDSGRSAGTSGLHLPAAHRARDHPGPELDLPVPVATPATALGVGESGGHRGAPLASADDEVSRASFGLLGEAVDLFLLVAAEPQGSPRGAVER